jgi:hypothetical protein
MKTPLLKKLWDQACDDAAMYHIDNGGVIEDFNLFVRNRYAALIIAQCIDAIESNVQHSLNISNFEDPVMQGIQLGLQFAVCDIEERFGMTDET